PALSPLLQSEDENTVIAALEALRKIGDEKLRDWAKARLGHPSARVREAAIDALCSLGDSDQTVDLGGLLADSSPRKREAAVKIAFHRRLPECLNLLFDCCADPEERI